MCVGSNSTVAESSSVLDPTTASGAGIIAAIGVGGVAVVALLAYAVKTGLTARQLVASKPADVKGTAAFASLHGYAKLDVHV